VFRSRHKLVYASVYRPFFIYHRGDSSQHTLRSAAALAFRAIWDMGRGGGRTGAEVDANEQRDRGDERGPELQPPRVLADLEEDEVGGEAAARGDGVSSG
jgi:hypothetical protein